MTFLRAARTVVCLTAIGTGGVGSGAEIVIHVSPGGDDSADGSAVRPLATLQAAQQKARASIISASGGVRVAIAPGLYRLPATLEFTSQDSGRGPNNRVEYSATAPGVVLSGGRKLEGWRQDGDRFVSKAALGEDAPPFRNLWINDRRAIRARTPNEGYFRVERAGPDNRTSFVAASAELQQVAKPAKAEVAFMHDWSMSRARIAGIDPATRTYRFDYSIGGRQPQFAISNFEPNPRYFVENAPELLDAPGEWFLDDVTSELTYLPREGESLDKLDVTAPRLEQLLIVRGTAGQPVRHLTFRGITFAHSRFEIPPYGYAGIQSAWLERRLERDDTTRVMLPAAVLLDGVENCRLEDCRFERLAACGLQLLRAKSVEVQRCIVRDAGGDGILVGSNDREEPAVTEKIAVENCLVERCGADYLGAVGIWVGFAAEVTVSNNEVRNLPYTGISVGWRWDELPTVCRDHVIRRNHIHHIMQELSDGGGIYTLGLQPGTKLLENHIHDVPQNAGRTESNGIFMDQGSSKITVQGNLIYNMSRAPIRFHMAGTNDIVGNRLVAPPGTESFTFNATDPELIVAKENDEISAASWQPSADDPTVTNAVAKGVGDEAGGG